MLDLHALRAPVRAWLPRQHFDEGVATPSSHSFLPCLAHGRRDFGTSGQTPGQDAGASVAQPKLTTFVGIAT